MLEQRVSMAMPRTITIPTETVPQEIETPEQVRDRSFEIANNWL
jgi:hypothetical protein